MPISNKSSQKRMTTTTIRLDPNEAQRRQQTQRTTITTNNNNDYQTVSNQTTDSYLYKTRTVVYTETPKVSVS
jgi:hypothetical protein